MVQIVKNMLVMQEMWVRPLGRQVYYIDFFLKKHILYSKNSSQVLRA